MRRRLTGQARYSRAHTAGYPNPLLRASDLRQARIRNWAVMIAILMVPVSLWLGADTHSEQQQRLDSQVDSIHRVTATTTAPARVEPVTATGFDSAGGAATTAVDARWVYRGIEHTGHVVVDVGSPAGTTTQIWVDAAGAPSVRPITSTDVLAASVFYAIGSWVLVASILAGFYYLARLHCDRLRRAQWDRALADLFRDH